MRWTSFVIFLCIFSPVAAINKAGETCHRTTRDEGLIRKACKGIEIESAMCAANVEEVDELLDSFAPLIDIWLGTDSLAYPECRSFWSERCAAVGGTVKEATECNEVCAALSSASVRCQDDGDCENQLIWQIPTPLPSLQESVSLAIGLACCSWVEQTLTDVCENVNATLLTDFLSLHTTADVRGSCRENADGVDCITPVVTEAGGTKTASSSASVLAAGWLPAAATVWAVAVTASALYSEV